MISLSTFFGGGGDDSGGGYDVFGGSGGWSLDFGGMSGSGGASLGLAGLQGLASFAATQAKIGQTKRNAASQEADYMGQARDEYLNAQQATIAGIGQVAGLRKQLAQVVGSRTAAAGAAGVDTGMGVAADNRTKIAQDADAAGAMDTMNADIAARRHRINAAAALYRSAATAQNADETEDALAGSGLMNIGLSLAKAFL